jgi:hypothetical protein
MTSVFREPSITLKTFASIPNGFTAFKEIPAGGLVQLLFFVGVLESSVALTSPVRQFPEAWQAIDFGWDTFDEETQFKKRHRAQPGPCRQMNPCPYGPTSNWGLHPSQ